MKIVYDPHTDTLTIQLTSGSIAQSDEDNPGVILDYDAQGNTLNLEVLDTSQRIPNAKHMDFEVAV